MSAERPLRAGFLMDQIAGHVTNYRNIRRIVDADPTIDATWFEIDFYREGGRIERVARRVHAPSYASGIMRGATEVRTALRSERFDALFTNSSVASLYARRFGRTPTILNYDSTPLQLDSMAAYGSPHDPKPIAWLKRTMTTRLYHRAALIEAWSNWARDSMIADYDVPADRVVVNPPGIDLSFWRPAPARNGERPVRVLFVGGDFERKGGKLLLEWMAGRDDDVELHVVTRDQIPRQANVIVHAGLQPNTAELLDQYHQADVFAMPSLGECFGIATVEAMAAGLPVVASDCGGTADIVDHGVNGLIVPTGDQPGLAAALDRLVADPAERARMAATSIERAAAHFDVRTNVGRIVASLHDVAQPSNDTSDRR